MDTNAFIQLEDIHCSLPNHNALRGVNLSIYPSEIHTILGEPGSGKTTLCRILNGLTRPSKGTIIIENKNNSFISNRLAYKKGIEAVYEDNPLFENLTVAANLFTDTKKFINSPFQGRNMYQKAQELLDLYGFSINSRSYLRDLSSPEKMIIGIIRHIIKSPNLILLDCVLDNLPTKTLEKIRKILFKLKQNDVSILLFTHMIDSVADFTDRVSILKEGKIIISDDDNKIDRLNLLKLAYSHYSNNQENYDSRILFNEILRYNEAILQELPLVLLIVDTNNRIKFINKAGCSFFHTESYYPDIPLTDILDETALEDTEILLYHLAEDKQTTLYNLTFIIGDFSILCNTTIYPVFEMDTCIGTLLLIDNITEQENLRKQLILSENLSSVGLLAAGVAHEINNPLEIIYNYLERISTRSSEPIIHQAVTNIEDEINSISSIIGNLVSFADTSEKPSFFNINELIEELLSLIEVNPDYKRITLSFLKKENPINIYANKQEIKQVLLNLIKNSFQAMVQEGSIIFRTDLQYIDEILNCTVMIEDTGPGIPVRTLNNIFLPFYSTKLENQHNYGLGLYISYGIIQKHNGSITVENRKEGGARFIIYLPLQ